MLDIILHMNRLVKSGAVLSVSAAVLFGFKYAADAETEYGISRRDVRGGADLVVRLASEVPADQIDIRSNFAQEITNSSNDETWVWTLAGVEALLIGSIAGLIANGRSRQWLSAKFPEQ